MTISGCKLFSGGARIDENPAEENRKEQSTEQTAPLKALIASVDLTKRQTDRYARWAVVAIELRGNLLPASSPYLIKAT